MFGGCRFGGGTAGGLLAGAGLRVRRAGRRPADAVRHLPPQASAAPTQWRRQRRRRRPSVPAARPGRGVSVILHPPSAAVRAAAPARPRRALRQRRQRLMVAAARHARRQQYATHTGSHAI